MVQPQATLSRPGLFHLPAEMIAWSSMEQYVLICLLASARYTPDTGSSTTPEQFCPRNVVVISSPGSFGELFGRLRSVPVFQRVL